jgi:hypothetical protein
MGTVEIRKESAAQRQLDAAIRILFGGEDILAVHTVGAAARRVLQDLADKRDPHILNNILIAIQKDVLAKLTGKVPSDDKLRRDITNFKRWFHRKQNEPANFLKHASSDPGASLDPDDMRTEGLLLEACALYGSLGLDLTPEMRAFSRWHLAVYPHEEGDKIQTAVGYVHELLRADQVEFGSFLLSLERGEDPGSEGDS